MPYDTNKMTKRLVYMMNPAILHPLIPHLTAISYGNLLCTCKELRDNYDIEAEWKRRSKARSHIKQTAMIKEGLRMYGAKAMLHEVTNIRNLNILLKSYRILKPSNLLNIYHEYLHSSDCTFHRCVSVEHCRLKYQTKKRKYISNSSMVCRKRRLYHMPR